MTRVLPQPRYVRSMWTGSLPFLLLLGGCTTCAGQRGTLVKPGSDVHFVTETGAVVATVGPSIIAKSLDGRRERTLFVKGHRIQDVSGDYRVWTASDDDTNLFIGELPAGTWRQVPQLDGILSHAVVSPDGTRVAASRHSDFSKQGSPNEDTLFIIDVKSLKVRVLPKTSARWPIRLRWSADGTALFANMAHGEPSQWIDVSSNARKTTKTATAALHVNPARHHGACTNKIVHDSFDPDIKVKDASGAIVTVVREQGRKRGMHDYQDDFGEPTLTPGCGYVLFSFGREQAWLADATGSGDLGPLLNGKVHFFADPSLLTSR